MDQAYTSNVPLNPKDQMLPQSKKTRSGDCATSFLCWFFQLGVWGLIGLSIYKYETYSPDFKNYCYALGFFYFMYLVLEFCSSTSKYLCNKKTDLGMYENMGKIFKTQPQIRFSCECYHYETVHYTERDKNGHVHHRTRREKRITHTDSMLVPYYSSRDVSGLFYLNCEKAHIQGKAYIKLELEEEINFADAISYSDYLSYKENFWRRNRFYDVHMDFHEKRSIPGLVHHNLIKMSAYDPCSVNFFWYFLFTLITLCQFYKLYVASFCVYQNFRIRKIISTRYDLNQPTYVQRYVALVPQINLITQQYTYEPSYYNYLNTGFNVKVPTEEELERAKKYQKFVPDYQVSSSAGDVQAGVIIDNPSYSSYNMSEPPPAFSQLGGNAALDASQVNAQGTVPQNFDKPGFNFNIASPQVNVPEVQDPTSSQGYTSGGGGLFPPEDQAPILPEQPTSIYQQPVQQPPLQQTPYQQPPIQQPPYQQQPIQQSPYQQPLIEQLPIIQLPSEEEINVQQIPPMTVDPGLQVNNQIQEQPQQGYYPPPQ